MRDRIFKEAIQWYENQDKKPNITDFVDLIINKTTDSVFEEVKKELKNEFDTGILSHPFVISSEYYLELKFKEIKENFIRTTIKMDYNTDEIK